MNPKVDEFLTELEELCAKYKLQLASSGYDGVQIWDKKPKEPGLYFNGIEDKTK